MAITLIKHWEDLDTFRCDVIDKRGDIFMYQGNPWVMVLRAPTSDRVREAVRKNEAEASGLRARRPASQRNDALPDEMLERHTFRIIQASHVAWENAPIDGDVAVDFDSDEFIEFLKSEPWYTMQWQAAWTDRKNSTRLKTDNKPKSTSSTGAKSR